MPAPLSGRMIRIDEGRVNGLHARGAGERAQEPVIDADRVVGVHAGQVAHLLPQDQLHHADDALGLLGAVELAAGQVLDQSDALGHAHLLLLLADYGAAAAAAQAQADADAPADAHLRGLEVPLSHGGRRVIVACQHLLLMTGQNYHKIPAPIRLLSGNRAR